MRASIQPQSEPIVVKTVDSLRRAIEAGLCILQGIGGKLSADFRIRLEVAAAGVRRDCRRQLLGSH
jgi:hypothetical protein